MVVETDVVGETIPFSCVCNGIRHVRPTAMKTDHEKQEETDLQHRQALFRGRAVDWVEGSGEEDIGRHLEVKTERSQPPVCVL